MDYMMCIAHERQQQLCDHISRASTGSRTRVVPAASKARGQGSSEVILVPNAAARDFERERALA